MKSANDDLTLYRYRVSIRIFNTDAEWLKKWALADNCSVAQVVQRVVEIAKTYVRSRFTIGKWFGEAESRAEVV